MAPLKRTDALPQDTLEEFERATPAGKRSAVIAELVRAWLERQKREKLRKSGRKKCQPARAEARGYNASFFPPATLKIIS
jgi:hypothetical protein